MTAAPTIHLQDVTVHYGAVLALDHATVAIGPGRVCGLVGMNGSGKSTLLKTITGVVHPDRGMVRIDGDPPVRARKAGRVSYMPQSEDLDWSFPLSVRDVVMTGRYGRMGLTRRPRRADQDAVDHAIEQVGLTGYAGRQIGQLSGGQRKRAFLARAIAQGATILLLDEPFAGVDTRSEATIIQLLRTLADDGATIVVATHDLRALPNLADEAVLLMRTVLMHADPHETLKPANLARAFGLDVLGQHQVRP